MFTDDLTAWVVAALGAVQAGRGGHWLVKSIRDRKTRRRWFGFLVGLDGLADVADDVRAGRIEVDQGRGEATMRLLSELREDQRRQLELLVQLTKRDATHDAQISALLEGQQQNARQIESLTEALQQSNNRIDRLEALFLQQPSPTTPRPPNPRPAGAKP